jgi:hypothetical protein
LESSLDQNGEPTRQVYVFILMPFGAEWSDDVHAVIERACEAVGKSLGIRDLRWERADQIATPGRVTDQIFDRIDRADAVIADITGNNPNVMLELGYSYARGKPAVLLNQAVDPVPFDLHDWRQIRYALNTPAVTHAALMKALGEAVNAAVSHGAAAMPVPTDLQQLDHAERERRRRLLGKLRQEWVLSNDGISPAMLAGTEPLPTEWVERRLQELGEGWKQDVYY